jgi:hypothetical protein
VNAVYDVLTSISLFRDIIIINIVSSSCFWAK